MTSASRMAWLLALSLPLTACFVRPQAVVVERSTARDAGVVPAPAAPAAARRSDARHYQVVRGDTLYGIAFRQGLDFRDLARWNGIVSPYTIYPGQRLRLSAPAGRDTEARPAPHRAAAPSPATGVIAGSASAAGSRGAAPPPSSPPPVRAPAVGAPTMPSPAPATDAAATAPTGPSTPAAGAPAGAPVSATTRGPTAASSPPRVVKAPPGPTRSVDGIQWRWPADGTIVSKHVAGDPTRQGINLAGAGGQPVYAAASGQVVYSGSGLIGYGELVIIKHSDTYLSAYGHNRRRLVSEGETVSAGQQIAEMGRTGAARDMLHFEIRRNGKPIDPIPLLPPR